MKRNSLSARPKAPPALYTNKREEYKQTKRGVILFGQLLSPENGGYLLSHKRSTIGAVGLNFSVRNGKRWNPDAIAT